MGLALHAVDRARRRSTTSSASRSTTRRTPRAPTSRCPTNNSYQTGEWGKFWVQAPTDSYIYRAEFGNIAHFAVPGYRSNAWHGLQNAAQTAWQSPVNFNNQHGQFGNNPSTTEGAYSGIVDNFCFYEPRCTAASPDGPQHARRSG